MNPTIPAPPAPPPPAMTADEFTRAHGDESGVELVDGQVVRLPMPGMQHGEVCGNAYAFIREHVKPRGLGRVVCNDTFVRTKRDAVRGADVMFVSYAQLPREQATPRGTLEVAPELVVEVRSPTDRPGYVDAKVAEYLAAGVKVVVVLDPAIDAATVYRPHEDIPQRFSNGDPLDLGDVLPGFAVPVRQFFE